LQLIAASPFFSGICRGYLRITKPALDSCLRDHSPEDLLPVIAQVPTLLSRKGANVKRETDTPCF